MSDEQKFGEKRSGNGGAQSAAAGRVKSASEVCVVSGFDVYKFNECRSREKIRDHATNGRPLSPVGFRCAGGGVALKNNVPARRAIAFLSAPAGASRGKKESFFPRENARGLGGARVFLARRKKSGSTLRGNGGNGGALLSPRVRVFIARADRVLLWLLAAAVCFFICAQAACCSERARLGEITRRRALVPFPLPTPAAAAADDPAGAARLVE